SAGRTLPAASGRAHAAGRSGGRRLPARAHDHSPREPVRLRLDDPACAAPRAREPARPSLDPSGGRGTALREGRGAGARPVAARRGVHSRRRFRRGAGGRRRDAVPLRRRALEPRHQRRPRPDLAHAGAQGVRGRREPAAMTRQLFVADRRSIEAWRIAVAREREAYEVVRADGGPEWRRVAPEAGERWALDDVPLPLVGPKRFFFPEREVLVRWRGDAADDRAPEPAPFALLGVRPCDLTAIAMLDRFFADDGAYRARRACGLVIGVNCASACSGGFCRDVDAGPFATAGFDVDLTVLSDDRI